MKRFEINASVVMIGLLALLPVLSQSSQLLNFMTYVLIVTLAAQGWNILAGFGGQFSFGHAAFFGVGAYGMALGQVRLGINPWLALPLAIAFGIFAGVIIGTLSFRARLRGSYFALVTLAFAEVLRIAANSAPFTGGAAGVLVPLRLSPANFQFDDRRALYVVSLLFVAAALAMSLGLGRTRFGAQLVAIRENEDAARALGVDVLVVKLKAIALSAGITAASGCLYVQKLLYLDANVGFGSWISVDALLAPIVGGLGTGLGPVIGTLTLLGLGEVTKLGLQSAFGDALPGADLVLFGALLVCAVAFAPRGLMGLADRAYTGGRNT